MLLSVRLMTYNHSEYIIECLKGIEQQQTSFNFEVIIGDDFSEDNNISLITEFIKSSKNKNIQYKLLNRKKGDEYDFIRQQKGRLYNFVDIINHCNGKYIALIDGDDYWIDPNKLQKQVDFLENNPSFNICFSRANALSKNEEKLHPIPINPNDGIFSFNDFLKHENFITTASAVVRNNIKAIPNWFYKLPYGDLAFYLIVSRDKKIKCLSDIMNVYRIHDNGLWQKDDKIKRTINKLLFNMGIFQYLTLDQQQIIEKKQNELINRLSALYNPNNKFLRKLKIYHLKKKYRLT